MKNIIGLMKDNYLKALKVNNYSFTRPARAVSSDLEECDINSLSYFLNIEDIVTENDYYNNIDFLCKYYKDLIIFINNLNNVSKKSSKTTFNTIYGLAMNIVKGDVFVAPKQFKFLIEDISDIISNILKAGLEKKNLDLFVSPDNVKFIETLLALDLHKKINKSNVVGFDVYINSIIKEQERNNSLKLENVGIKLNNESRLVILPLSHDNIKVDISSAEEVCILIKYLSSIQFVKVLYMLQCFALSMLTSIIEE